MNVEQKAFVQWLFTERIVVEEDMTHAVASLLSKECSLDDLYQFINPIRDELRPFDLDIPRIRYEPWQKYALGIVNTNDDDIAKISTGYSATEIAAFKKIIGELEKQKAFQISQIDLKCVLMSTKTLELSGTKAENLLQRDHNGKLVLGPKAIMELKELLLEENFNECAFCKNLIASGHIYKCSDSQECAYAVHEACSKMQPNCVCGCSFELFLPELS